MRDSHSQHRITQEFQALVVVGGKTAVRQGALQQRRVAKGMLQTGLQAGQARA